MSALERSDRPVATSGSGASSLSGARDSVAANIARAAIRHLVERGLQPTPANYLQAWKAVGGPVSASDEQAATQPNGQDEGGAFRSMDTLRKTHSELLEIVRTLCESIESMAERDSWLAVQVQAIRESVGSGADRRSLAAARAMLENARQSQHDLHRNRRDALGVLRGLLPDLIAQMTQQPRDARGIRGAIVTIGSIASFGGIPGRNAYCAAKAGVLGMTRALASEWARRGIRVNAVAPGYVKTALVANLVERGAIDAQAIARRTPMGRMAAPEEIAQVIAFLASPLASYITGAVLPVDGGWTALGAPEAALGPLEED